MQKIPAYRWPPTHRLLAARFLADFEQLQNRDFAISNRSKPIRVLTRKKSLYMLDRLPIGYHLPDFQLIWSNFKIEISQLQTALNPYEFWRACFYPTSDDHLPKGYSLPDFQHIWSNFKIEIFQLQMNFESQYTHKSVDTQKLLCLLFLI